LPVKELCQADIKKSEATDFTDFTDSHALAWPKGTHMRLKIAFREICEIRSVFDFIVTVSLHLCRIYRGILASFKFERNSIARAAVFEGGSGIKKVVEAADLPLLWK
jgi:hypothetical protein